MAKRLPQRIGRRKRLHPVYFRCTEVRTAFHSIMRQQRSSLSRRNCSENIGREPGPDDPFFFEPIAAVPNFLSDESTDEVWKWVFR